MQDETISNSACSIREKTDGYMKNMVREKGVWEGKPRRRDIRMIALDLDGTALNKEMKVTERTAEALEEAARRGIQVIIATGRTYHTLPEQLFEIDGLKYAVTSNGAVINELKTGKAIYRNCIPAAAVEQATEILKGRFNCSDPAICSENGGCGEPAKAFSEISVEVFTEGNAYLEKAELDDIRKNGSSYRNALYVSTTRKPAEGILDFMLAHRDRIENICLNFPDVSLRPVWKQRLSVLPEVTLTTSLPYNLEIGGTTVSKAEALRFLMKETGIKPAQLMACGDSQNDAAMIRLAGLGIEMKNSSDEMKEIADYVTDSNETEGVAKAIENFIL